MKRVANARAAGLVGVALIVSCAPDFDAERRAAPQGTVGEEVFNVMCERLHVGESPLDVSFARGRAPCTRGLTPAAPAPSGVGPKTVALARMRSEVTAGLDLAMPRDTYAPLDRLLLNLLPLYGPDGSRRVDAMRRPLVITTDGGTTRGEDLLPQTTRALSSLVTQIAGNADALAALERMSLRRGYRPPNVAFGLLRPVLAYDRVDGLLDTTFRLFRDPSSVAPGGPANEDFNRLFEVLRGEFADARPATTAESVGGTTVDAIQDLVFRESDELRAGQAVEVVRRNACGFAQLRGPIAAPFVDTDMNGVVDTVRCVPVNAQRQPIVDAPSPYRAPFAPDTPRDAAGRATVTASDARYVHANLNASMLGALTRQLPPLLAGNDPAALRLVHGAQGLLGERAMTTRVYSNGPVAYRQFAARTSPLVGLTHALGVLLTHRDAPRVLSMAQQLMAGPNAQKTARLVAALLAIDAISDRNPAITMAPTSVIWDDVLTQDARDPERLGVVQRIAQEPGLLEDLFDAMADMTRPLAGNDLWQPERCRGTVPTQNLANAFRSFMGHRDRLEPNWTDTRDVGGFPAWNEHVTTSASRVVDRARPDTQSWQQPGSADDNRSMQQRLFHVVDDLDGAPICNKSGAAVRIRFNVPLLGEQAIGVPGATNIPACELVQVPDSAVIFLRTVAGGRRAVLPLNIPGFLGTVTDIARRFGVRLDSTLDGLVQSQSQIRGFNSLPTPFAIARLVFNPAPNAFLRDLVDPAPIRNADGVDLARSPEYAVRNYHRGTIFAWETQCFYDSVRPLALAFVRHDRHRTDGRLDPTLALDGDPATMHPRNIDSSRGAKLFVQLFGAFHRHWATERSGDMQSSTRCVTCRAGRNYSYTDGAGRYEPILTEALSGDLMLSIGEATVALRELRFDAQAMCADRRNPGRRAPCTGIDVLAATVRALVLPNPVALDGMPAFAAAPSTRDGAARTLWSDGTTPAPVTVYSLFADNFNAMDPLLARNAAQRASWEAARSALVDQLMATDGATTSTRFRNAATPAITRTLLDWVLARMAAHRAAGDYESWARDPAAGLAGRFQSVAEGPAFASALDLGLAVYNDPEARATFAAFLTHLLSENTVGDPTRTGNNLSTTLAATAELLQVARVDQDLDPFLRALAPAFAPRTGAVALSLRFLDRARDGDPDRVLTRVLGNMARRPAGDDVAREPLAVVADAIADTHRRTPGDRGPLAAQDFGVMLRNVAEFFSDERRGMEQFYSIVQQRRLPR